MSARVFVCMCLCVCVCEYVRVCLCVCARVCVFIVLMRLIFLVDDAMEVSRGYLCVTVSTQICRDVNACMCSYVDGKFSGIPFICVGMHALARISTSSRACACVYACVYAYSAVCGTSLQTRPSPHRASQTSEPLLTGRWAATDTSACV